MNEKLLKALLAAGLTQGLAATITSLVKVEKDEEIEGIAKSFGEMFSQPAIASEIDRRVTSAVKTAIDNYEKKHQISN